VTSRVGHQERDSVKISDRKRLSRKSQVSARHGSSRRDGQFENGSASRVDDWMVIELIWEQTS
jgi:hypothetical protein